MIKKEESMSKSYVFFADGFEEIEALTAVDVLRRAGMSVVTVSINSTLEVTGAHDVTVKADTKVSDVDLHDAQWLVLPGGMPGATNLANCEAVCRALKAQNDKGGGIAAICASPSVVFGPLGLLEGKKAVCYPGMEAGMEGAVVGDGQVAVDGNIITGNGPAAATAFALAIAEAAQGKDAANAVAGGMLYMG